MEKLDWQKLLSVKRERPTSRPPEEKYVARNEFEADYDRIVGSSSVRRLQDKAQVFPLQENDVARTRLTHSIEVSALARSLGKAVGRELEEKNFFTPKQTDELAAVLQVAGLIHDLGNPPFGHYGESVIQQWFAKWISENPLLKTKHILLTEQEQNDFLFFDGNVQNLRIVSKLQVQNDTYGANFTYATLGTIMKYPWPSHERWEEKKKFGYFKSEKNLAEDIRRELGLGKNVRHPATYLLEAADDIIYLCDDIEDGVKKGCIDWSKEYKKLREKLSDGSPELKALTDEINQKFIDGRMPEGEQITARVRNFRNKIQSHLFKRCVQTFIDHYDEIMSNKAHPELELLSCESALVDELKRITRENSFRSREVLSLEVMGDKVISTLLDVFVLAMTESTGKDLLDTQKYAGKLFAFISPNFVFRVLNTHMTEEQIAKELEKKKQDPRAYLEKQLDELSIYDRLHIVTDFISGMTDSYAVNLYQELMGMKHPGGR